MKTNTRILIVVFALLFGSMGAHLATSAEAPDQLPNFQDHPHIAGSSIHHQKSMKRLLDLPNLPKRLRNKLGARNPNVPFTNERNNKFREQTQHQTSQPKQINLKNQADDNVLLSGWQQDVLIVNSSTVLSISPYQIGTSQYIVLNLINITSKANFKQLYSQFKVQGRQIASKLLDQDTVAVFSCGVFLVFNTKDLTLRQQISIPNSLYYYSYSIDTHLKNDIFLGYLNTKYHTLGFNTQTNKYENLTEFYKPDYQLYRVNSKEGFTFWNYHKVPVNLTNQFKILSKKVTAPALFQTVSVVSHSEEIVAAAYDYVLVNDSLIFSSLNKINYELTTLFTVNIPEKFFIDPRKVRFTPDDKSFFFNINQTQINYRAVGVIKVATGKVTYFDMDGEKMTDFECLDFGILSNTQFVLACRSLSKNKLVSAQNQYQLWLYNMSNFKLLDTYSVLADATNVEIKTNPNFNSSFILQTFDAKNKPTLRMFQVVNSRITTGIIPSSFTNFRIVADGLSYIIGMFGDEPYHSFVNIKNFAVVKKTPIYDFGHQYNSSDIMAGIKDYMVQNNVIAICNQKILYSTCEMYQFYDLSKLGMPGDADLLCFYFPNENSQLAFFLPKANYVFQNQDNQFQQLIGYDLQKCPTKKMIPLQIKRDSDEKVQASLYKWSTSPNKSKKNTLSPTQQQQSCNLIYLLGNNNKIYTVQDCEPYKLLSVTTIPSNIIDGYTCFATKLYFSSNFKYLIVYLLHRNNAAHSDFRYQLEVRPLNDLDKCVFRTQIEVLKSISGTPDVTEKDELVYATFQGVYLDKMDIKAEGFGNEAKSQLLTE